MTEHDVPDQTEDTSPGRPASEESRLQALLAQGEALIAEARETLAELDAALAENATHLRLTD
jgi:hypothetical protein